MCVNSKCKKNTWHSDVNNFENMYIRCNYDQCRRNGQTTGFLPQLQKKELENIAIKYRPCHLIIIITNSYVFALEMHERAFFTLRVQCCSY